MLHDMLIPRIIIALALLTVGCEKPCEVPPGKYEITYTKLEGDCPDEFVAQFDGQKSELDVEAGVCRRFAFQHTAELPNGCELDTDMSAQLEATGVKDGQAAMTLRCVQPQPYTCRHLFTVDYRRKR